MSMASAPPVLWPDSRVLYDSCRGHGHVCLIDAFRPLHPRRWTTAPKNLYQSRKMFVSNFLLARRRFCIVALIIKYISDRNVHHEIRTCIPSSFLCRNGPCLLIQGSTRLLRGTIRRDSSDGLTWRDSEPLMLVGGHCEGVEVGRLRLARPSQEAIEIPLLGVQANRCVGRDSKQGGSMTYRSH